MGDWFQTSTPGVAPPRGQTHGPLVARSHPQQRSLSGGWTSPMLEPYEVESEGQHRPSRERRTRPPSVRHDLGCAHAVSSRSDREDVRRRAMPMGRPEVTFSGPRTRSVQPTAQGRRRSTVGHRRSCTSVAVAGGPEASWRPGSRWENTLEDVDRWHCVVLWSEMGVSRCGDTGRHFEADCSMARTIQSDVSDAGENVGGERTRRSE